MHRFTILATAVLLTAQSGFSAPFIVDDGAANAQIVIDEPAIRTQRLAARELQRYVKKISGAELPIGTAPSENYPVTLYVGRSAYTEELGIDGEDLKYGAYRIVSGKDWLALVGHDSEFTPIEPWPRSRGESASDEFQQAWDKVANGHTWICPIRNMWEGCTTHPARLKDVPGPDERVDVWEREERGSFNAVCGFLRDLGVRWYMAGELGEVVPRRATIELPEVDTTVRPDMPVMREFRNGSFRSSRELADWLMRLGARNPYGFMVGHGMVYVTGREEMRKKHPEYYAQYGDAPRNGPQLCYASEGLFKETVAFARTLFDHYDMQVVSVMPPDGFTRICECPECRDKATPERGDRGSLSDYVWDWVNRVAAEVGKTHPDRKITCLAYGPFTEPPLQIERLEPNVLVGIVGGRRPTSERREYIQQLRKGWLAKTDNRIYIFENYPGGYLPAFVPHTNASSIHATKGDSLGEHISLGLIGRNTRPGFSHFKVYFTARMYWGGKDRDIDAMLEEYYRLFYGPAEKEMQAFFEYCETHWEASRNDKPTADRILALFAAAQEKAEADTVYGKRLALMDDFLDGLRDRSAQLEKAKQREGAPELRMWPGPHWRGPKEFNLDGKLDETFWTECRWGRARLRTIEDGKPPEYGTEFVVGTGPGGVYFGIRCERDPNESVDVATTEDDDPAIWEGDVLDILLETQKHSYYHIAVNPAGAICDLDRAGGKEVFRWDSQAQVATHVGEDYWSAEIVIPVVGETTDPFHQVVGRRKPPRSLPWYFNLCRRRVGEDATEWSAFSPTGRKSCLVPEKFALLYDHPRR